MSRNTAAGAAALTLLWCGQALGQTLAELPRDSVTIPSAPAACTRTVRPDDNLQASLRRARSGDVICLVPGATYSAIVLPTRADTGWVVLRTAAPDSAFAVEGERLRPSRAGALARIVQSNSDAAVRTQLAASGWRLIGLEVTTTVMSYGIVTLGEPGAPQKSSDVVAKRIILDRLWIHGSASLTVRRCVALNSAWTAIVNSWLDDCHEKGADSQAIAGWNGPGPYRIENNTLAGAGENVIFGGADPSIANLVTADVTISRNHFVTPISWKGRWTKKNLFELKNGARFLIEGNVMEGSWGDGQTGFAVVLKSTNQSGKCPWCGTSDVTFQRNLVRNVGAGVDLIGKEGGHPFDTDSISKRLVLRENQFEVDMQRLNGEGRLLQMVGGPRQILFERNVMLSTGYLKSAVALQRRNSAFNVVLRNNVFAHGQYGMVADDLGAGAPALAALSDAKVSGNVFLVGPGSGRAGNVPGFSYATSLATSIVYQSTTRAVKDATRGVVVDP